jgi:hypothetical protein
MEIAIPLGALIAAIAPLWAMLILSKERANTGLKKDLADQLAECRQERRRLEEENLVLMRKLLANER